MWGWMHWFDRMTCVCVCGLIFALTFGTGPTKFSRVARETGCAIITLKDATRYQISLADLAACFAFVSVCVCVCFLTLGPDVPGNPMIPASPFGPGKPGPPGWPGYPGCPGCPLLCSAKPGSPGRPWRPGRPGRPLSPETRHRVLKTALTVTYT